MHRQQHTAAASSKPSQCTRLTVPQRCEKSLFLLKSLFWLFLGWQTGQRDCHSTGCSSPKCWGANPSDPGAQLSRTVWFWGKRCWAVCMISLIWHGNFCASVSYCSFMCDRAIIFQDTSIEPVCSPVTETGGKKRTSEWRETKVMKDISFKYWT